MAKYFKLSEFACHDGTPVPLIYMPNILKLMKVLDIIREELGPIIIVSGYRTKKYNMSCGGAAKSCHLYAKAADIRCENIHSKIVYNCILKLIEQKRIPDGGLGLYDTFCHIDTGRPRRW